MLVVRVELHSAVTGKMSEIARMTVGNVGGSHTHGDYLARIKRAPKFVKTTRDSSVRNYRRLSRPVWDLVCLALKNAGYGK